MKLHHFALLFLVVAGGMFVTARIRSITKMQNESMRKIEYDCLVAAVDAVADTVFGGMEDKVTKDDLEQAETVFFQMLGVLHEGTTDRATWEEWRNRVPCFVIFDKVGYYVYSYAPEIGYVWSELQFYENGQIPDSFFRDTEELLLRYQRLTGSKQKNYRMEAAGKSVWEQCITAPCVFAVYAPSFFHLTQNKECNFLYAASGWVETAYYVTEDNYCHSSFCENLRDKKVIARYVTQKESAKDGISPCERCMK